MDKNKCNSCGESAHKCSCKNKDFTKAVIEIDNPEQITLMRKVVIPASMGDDTVVPPVIGKYHNVLLNYEANNKSYLYSSDGIPTLLTGAQGEQGPAGTVTVGTTTTGEPGSSASVENVGTLENAVLNFTVPQGPRVPEEEVQEDVDNKLDEMAEDGTLADIIWQYWRVNGTGITTKHNIYSDGDNKTDYWVTFIPRIRPDGEINELKQHLVGQEGQSLTGKIARPASVARNNGYKLCINSATFIQEAGDEQYKTNNKYLIQDGVQIPTNGTRTNLLCIMNDGTLRHYDASNMTAQQLIDAGVKYSLTAFYTVIEDGNITAEIQSKEDWTTLYQRQVIAQDAEKNIYIFTCDGKNGNGGNYNVGMNMQQVANLLLDNYDVTFAFMLDGGGSTSTVVDGIVLNQLSDNINRDERYVPFMLYVEDNKPQSMIDTYNAIGQEIDYLKKEIWDTSYCVRISNNITESAETQADRTVMYYRLGGGQYTGSDLPHNDYKYSIAEVITRDDGSRIIRVFGNISNHSNIAVRHCVNNVWSGWTYITESDNTTLSLTSSYGSFTNDTKTNVTNDVATVAFRLDLSSAASANDVIVSGLKGSKISMIPVIAWDNNNSTFVNLKLTYDGTIVATANIASNASLRFNFSYLTK